MGSTVQSKISPLGYILSISFVSNSLDVLTNECTQVGEDKYLIAYVKNKYKEIYGADVVAEFEEKALIPQINCGVNGNYQLNIKYGKNIQNTKAQPSAKTKVAKRSNKHASKPQIIYYLSNKTTCNESDFKAELLNTKKAHFVLTYDSGTVSTTPWNANNFTSTSSVSSNIHSKTFWRSKTEDGLLRVEVYID